MRNILILCLLTFLIGCDSNPVANQHEKSSSKIPQQPQVIEPQSVGPEKEVEPEKGEAETKPSMTPKDGGRYDFKSMLAKLSEKYPNGEMEITDGAWFEVTVVVDNFDFQNNEYFIKQAIEATGPKNGFPEEDSISIKFWFNKGRLWEKTTSGETVTIRGELRRFTRPMNTVIQAEFLNCQFLETTATVTPPITAELVESVKAAGKYDFGRLEIGKTFFAKGKIVKIIDEPDINQEEAFVFRSEDGLLFNVLTNNSSARKIIGYDWKSLKEGDEVELAGGTVVAIKDQQALEWRFPIWASLFK